MPISHVETNREIEAKMTQRERILVTVRTYPNPSSKYSETVCTGGVTDTGQWRRLYPVPLRYLDEDKKYATYDIIDVSVEDGKDGRPETRRPNCQTIKVVSKVDSWEERWKWVGPTILASVEEMTSKNRTLGPVAVREVKEFVAKETAADWTARQKERLKQEGLFSERKPLEKIPFDFRMVWVDEGGKEWDSLVIAWEFGETWRNWRAKYENPIERMRDKWMNEICCAKNRVTFFMGNSAEHRQVFMVCGIFYPPNKVAENAQLF
jgi:hypothetical protein